MGSNIDLNGNLNWHGDNAHIHSMMGDIDIMSDMGDVRINSMMGGDFDVDMEQIDMHGWMGINLNGTTNINGTTSINGDVIGSNPPTMPDHLTRKDYVDAGDAALLDSLNALDSVVTANALWVDNGSGNITNTNNGDIHIDGDNIDIEGNHTHIGDGYNGINVNFGNIDINGNAIIDGTLDINGNIDISGNTTISGYEFRVMDSFWNEKLKVDYIGDVYMSGNNNYISGVVNISGDATFDGDVIVNGSFTYASDKRFKKDIVTVNNALSKVLQLRGVNYYWRNNEFPNRGFDDKLELGLIAQEVEVVIPEIVAEIGDGYKGVEYSKLVALLVEAIKEQQAIIDGQKTEMADMRVELDGRLKALEEMFNTATLNK